MIAGPGKPRNSGLRVLKLLLKNGGEVSSGAEGSRLSPPSFTTVPIRRVSRLASSVSARSVHQPPVLCQPSHRLSIASPGSGNDPRRFDPSSPQYQAVKAAIIPVLTGSEVPTGGATFLPLARPSQQFSASLRERDHRPAGVHGSLD